jgi:selT/selW/selH-like putative selenoprotein
VFEVTVDGTLVFSKKALGRFPEDGEVLGIMRKAPKR